MQLSELRDAGDVKAYESAREAAMQAALDAGNEAEFLRITNEHRPAHQPQYVPPAAEPTEQELENLQQIFDSPKYQTEMLATDGDPEKMNEVYERHGVPQEARLTSVKETYVQDSPYRLGARADGGGRL